MVDSIASIILIFALCLVTTLNSLFLTFLLFVNLFIEGRCYLFVSISHHCVIFFAVSIKYTRSFLYTPRTIYFVCF